MLRERFLLYEWQAVPLNYDLHIPYRPTTYVGALGVGVHQA